MNRKRFIALITLTTSAMMGACGTDVEPEQAHLAEVWESYSVEMRETTCDAYAYDPTATATEWADVEGMSWLDVDDFLTESC